MDLKCKAIKEWIGSGDLDSQILITNGFVDIVIAETTWHNKERCDSLIKDLNEVFKKHGIA